MSFYKHLENMSELPARESHEEGLRKMQHGSITEIQTEETKNLGNPRAGNTFSTGNIQSDGPYPEASPDSLGERDQEVTGVQGIREVSRFDDCSETRAPEQGTPTDIDAYADWTVGFWFSGKGRPEKESVAIMGLGLAGEAGEVVEHLKKFVRDDHINVSELKKELGDSIYYWCRICKQFGLEPTEVIQANVEKLESRKARGVLRGDGDNR